MQKSNSLKVVYLVSKSQVNPHIRSRVVGVRRFSEKASKRLKCTKSNVQGDAGLCSIKPSCFRYVKSELQGGGKVDSLARWV